MRVISCVFIMLWLAGASLPAQSTIRQVPGQYPTIQAAVDAALTGDVVEVADGTYTGPGNRDISLLGKAITVRSQNGPAGCILDCGGSGADARGFSFTAGETAASLLEGFTITRAWKAFSSGGGIYINAASPTIRNCWIGGNIADGVGYGGGIYAVGSNAQIIDCVIANNVAGGYHNMGGVGGIYGTSSNLTIAGCTIARNQSGSYHTGGMVLDNGSVSRTIIWGNCAGPFSDFAGTAVFACCAFNPDGFGGGEFIGPQVNADPLYCSPVSCNEFLQFGDYSLRSDSPCLPENSPCGALIGALGTGCSAAAAPAPAVKTPPLRLRVGPNPSREFVRYEVVLAGPAEVRAQLVDVGGRLLRESGGTRLQPGVHRLSLDLLSGEPLPAGAYYLRVEADGSAQTARVFAIR